MENKGIVKKIEGNNLYIELFRDSSCAHCSGCGKADKTIKDLYKYKLTEGQGILVSFITLVVSFCGFYFYDRKAGKERVSEEISIKSVVEEEEIIITTCGTRS